MHCHNLTRFLQLGHSSFSFNHELMQLLWNMWLHKRAFTCTPVFKTSKQIEHVICFSDFFCSILLFFSVWLLWGLSTSFVFADLCTFFSSVSSYLASSNLNEGIALIINTVSWGEGIGLPSRSNSSSSSKCSRTWSSRSPSILISWFWSLKKY